MRRAFAQMPLAENRRLITMLLQQFGIRLQSIIYVRRQRGHAVDVIIGARQNRSAAGRTDGIGAKTIIKSHAALRDAVDIRSLINAAAISADSVRSVIVRHDEENVRLAGFHGESTFIMIYW